MPSRELRRMQQKLGLDKRREQVRKKAPSRRKGPKRERVSVSQFLTEVRAEMKRVTWPTREEVLSYTLVVIITVLVVGGIVALADYVFTYLVKLIIL
ncbi:MAG: preprotein translocase subunit SecE [Candidatus Geothermincolales bacterium]